MQKESLVILLQRYIGHNITDPEMEDLANYINQPENKDRVTEALAEVGMKMASLTAFDNARFGPLLQKILAADKPAPVIPILKRAIFKWAAAAVIILMLGLGGYFSFFNDQKRESVKVASQEQRFKNDISPARQQVVLTLADGSTKILDSIGNGTVTTQGATQLIKKDGSITYINKEGSQVYYNTVTAEKGRTFHLRLADGTGVWLDALSSIRFPTAFPGAERVVEITGQAYFEVATLRLRSGQKQPFKVISGNQVIEVLGTHFNINTYNQQDLQTTLLEGSVKVTVRQTQGDKTQMLQPGQQTSVNNGIIKVTADVDLAEVMAWKNGRFQFNGSRVEDIMNQLSRWYNIEIDYKDKIKETFVADVSRDLPVSKLLGLLEMTKQIKFAIEGNKVTVMKW
jgi:transmembrane sensor